MKNPFVEARKQNIQLTKELIRDHKEPMPHSKIIALLGVYGVTEKTANSYLKVLHDAGFIEWNPESKAWIVPK